MKYCGTCKRLLPIEEFHRDSTRKGGYAYRCKLCALAYVKGRYKIHQTKYRANAIISKAKRKAAAIDHLTAYLKDKSCTDCGNTDPITFEFDHIKGNKMASICKLVENGVPWERISKEIEKCELVCANCHRRRTAFRGNWWRSNLVP